MDLSLASATARETVIKVGSAAGAKPTVTVLADGDGVGFRVVEAFHDE